MAGLSSSDIIALTFGLVMVLLSLLALAVAWLATGKPLLVLLRIRSASSPRSISSDIQIPEQADGRDDVELQRVLVPPPCHPQHTLRRSLRLARALSEP
ncbi:hypothetical protein N7488_009179 [Penicillium malachiteum]|nr:hypothetical protein N7488_009179 [Penicillium malachiteum]